MNQKVFGLVLLALGVVLIGYGLNASHSLASNVSQVVSGTPSDKVVGFYIAGGLLVAFGVGTLASDRS